MNHSQPDVAKLAGELSCSDFQMTVEKQNACVSLECVTAALGDAEHFLLQGESAGTEQDVLRPWVSAQLWDGPGTHQPENMNSHRRQVSPRRS